MGCSAGWRDAARDAVDAVNTSTTLAWEEYAKEAQHACEPVIADCAQKHEQLEQCANYQLCVERIKGVAQSVIALHELVEQTRRVFDALEDLPESASSEERAKHLWRLVLKHASTIADALAQRGVPMEVPQ